MLRYLKQFDEAAAVCRAFLAKNTDNETANLMLAEVLFDAGAASQAQQALQAAEQAAKDPRLFLMRAASVCSRAGDHERAIAYAARLAEQSPADFSAVSLRVDVLMKAGKEKEAAQVAVDAQKAEPGIRSVPAASRVGPDGGEAERSGRGAVRRIPEAPARGRLW